MFAQYANVRIAVLGGSSAESVNNKGSAQFLAAGAYSGNQFNTGIRFMTYFETLGAKVNAVADREKIVFQLKVLTTNLDEAFAALASAVSSEPYAPHVVGFLVFAFVFASLYGAVPRGGSAYCPEPLQEPLGQSSL